MTAIRRLLGTPVLLRHLALASLLANVGLVVTGGAVRLTGSGLGCPTWPRCTATSYVTTSAMGVHGMIEFGNRLVGVAVGLLALACLVVAAGQAPQKLSTAPGPSVGATPQKRQKLSTAPGPSVGATPQKRQKLVGWSAAVLAGIPAQAVVGGLTVLTKLNPWVVGCHFLASMAVIAAAYQLWVRAGRRVGGTDLPRPLVLLARLVVGTAVAVLVIGAVVTGSGPHAGDANARRTGLDPQEVAQFHADLVFLLIGLSVALWFALRAVDARPSARQAVSWLIAVEAAQGGIGFVQYFTHLPALAVGLHMLGACAVWVATLAVLEETRRAAAPASTNPAPASTNPAAASAVAALALAPTNRARAAASDVLPATLARPSA